jgi:hypothetical protein
MRLTQSGSQHNNHKRDKSMSRKSERQKTMLDFDGVVGYLKTNGYTQQPLIESELDKPGCRVAMFNGHKVRIAVGESGAQTYSSIIGRVAMDNAKAFDKWSSWKVPVSIKLPIDPCRLQKALDACASDEGFKTSCVCEKIDFDHVD